MLRISNQEINENGRKLIERLRKGWGEALKRENLMIGMDADEYSERNRSVSSEP